MTKRTTQYVCQNCGAVFAKWAGKCDACGEWNTLAEESLPEKTHAQITAGKGGKKFDFVDLRGAPEIVFRLKSQIGE